MIKTRMMRGTNRPRTLPKKLKGSPSNRQCSMALPRCRTKGQQEYKRMLAWPVQRRITAGYVTGDYDPQLPLVRHLHALGVRRDSTQSSGHDNGNVHRAAANTIVSKSRAARGSVCNVLLCGVLAPVETFPRVFVLTALLVELTNVSGVDCFINDYCRFARVGIHPQLSAVLAD